MKVLRTGLIRQIQIEEQGFGAEPEIVAKIARMGTRIVEMPISFQGRWYEEGKKIRPRDGLHAVYCILKYNLRGRWRLWP
jgi:hypothetical protein